MIPNQKEKPVLLKDLINNQLIIDFPERDR